jgi:hypothetical protein
MRRLWQGLAVILAALAWTFTFVPPIPLPLGFAPAIFATACAVLVIVSQSRASDAPRQHVADLHRLTDTLLEDIGAFRALRFGQDPRSAQVWRRSFEAHFGRVARDLRDWDRLLKQDVAASQPVIARIQRECGALEATHGLNVDHCRAVLQKAVDSQLVAQPPAIAMPGPFSIQRFPGGGWMLFLGGSGIAHSESQSELATAQAAMELAARDVPNWPELLPARNARLALMRRTASLRTELIEVMHRHALARVARCPACSN